MAWAHAHTRTTALITVVFGNVNLVKRAPIRKLFVLVIASLGALMFAGIASAHNGTVTLNCHAATFSFDSFPDTEDTVTLTVIVDGTPSTSSFTFHGPVGATSVPLDLTGNHTVTGTATWTADSGGSASATQTLTCGAGPPSPPVVPKPANGPDHTGYCQIGTEAYFNLEVGQDKKPPYDKLNLVPATVVNGVSFCPAIGPRDQGATAEIATAVATAPTAAPLAPVTKPTVSPQATQGVLAAKHTKAKLQRKAKAKVKVKATVRTAKHPKPPVALPHTL